MKLWAIVPTTAFPRALYALPSALEEVRKAPAACFCFGIDDTLQSGPVTAFLVRFEANGPFKDGDKLLWDFGDGTTGSGRSLQHVYFKPGNYKVTLTSAGGPAPFKRNVFVHPFHEENPRGLIDLVGADNIIFGSDFPHPEGLADPISFIDEIKDLAEDTVQKIMGGNLHRLMNVQPEKVAA